MNRRLLVKLLGSAAGISLLGCEMNGKKNIRGFGKTFAYLNDPVLRKSESGNVPLVVEGAEFSGARFDGVDWKKITFRNCDFVGAYDIKPASIEDAVFEGCRFSGIFNLGTLKNVRFIRCLIADGSHVVGDVGSTNVVFDSCEMMGSDREPNHWGSFGAYGDVSFIRCKARRTNLSGETKHLMRECEFEDIHCGISKDGGGSLVLIENCKLRGRFRLAPALIQSLTIRDTVIDTLDLTGTTIKEELLMERVRGGSVEAVVKGAKRLAVRDSQFTPSASGGKFAFSLASNDAQEVLIENTSILGDNILVDIGGGPHTESLVFRKSKFSRLDLQYAHAKHLLLQDFEANSVRLNDARIGKLEMNSAVFALTLDLSNTQVHEFKKTGGTNLTKLGGLKLDGSNIHLPQ